MDQMTPNGTLEVMERHLLHHMIKQRKRFSNILAGRRPLMRKKFPLRKLLGILKLDEQPPITYCRSLKEATLMLLIESGSLFRQKKRH